MIKDLQQKHDLIVMALQSELENHKMEQEEVHSTGLIKLPRAVRSMTVKEFNQQHSCDLLALLKSKDGVYSTIKNKTSSDNASLSSSTVVDMVGKKRDYQHSVMETPAPRSRLQTVPGTAMRTARKGEGLL